MTTTSHPAPAGRPPMPPSLRLTDAARIRVTRPERDLIAAAARHAGIPLATYIRHAAVAAAKSTHN